MVLPAAVAEAVAARARPRPVGEVRGPREAVHQPVRPEEALAHEVGIALAADALDDEPGGVAAEVRVLEAGAGFEGGRRRLAAGDAQPGLGRARLAGLEVRVERFVVGRQAVAVRQQMADGDARVRVFGHDRLHGAVHREPPFVHKRPQARRGEGLGERPAIARRRGREGDRRRMARLPEAARENKTVVTHHRYRAAELLRGHQRLDQRGHLALQTLVARRCAGAGGEQHRERGAQRDGRDPRRPSCALTPGADAGLDAERQQRA